MAERLSDLSVGSLKTTGKKVRGLALPSIVETQQVAITHQINQIPAIQPLLQIPGIQPFLIPELVPDLIYLFQTGGLGNLQEAIQRSDPSHPESIIFNHPFQEVNKNTLKVEIELILNEPEVIERNDIQCRCGSRRIQVSAPIQTRSADEPATYFARCVECKKKWKFSAA